MQYYTNERVLIYMDTNALAPPDVFAFPRHPNVPKGAEPDNCVFSSKAKTTTWHIFVTLGHRSQLLSSRVTIYANICAKLCIAFHPMHISTIYTRAYYCGRT
jgi:hypothetical protein